MNSSALLFTTLLGELRNTSTDRNPLRTSVPRIDQQGSLPRSPFFCGFGRVAWIISKGTTMNWGTHVGACLRAAPRVKALKEQLKLYRYRCRCGCRYIDVLSEEVSDSQGLGRTPLHPKASTAEDSGTFCGSPYTKDPGIYYTGLHFGTPAYGMDRPSSSVPSSGAEVSTASDSAPRISSGNRF